MNRQKTRSLYHVMPEAKMPKVLQLKACLFMFRLRQPLQKWLRSPNILHESRKSSTNITIFLHHPSSSFSSVPVLVSVAEDPGVAGDWLLTLVIQQIQAEGNQCLMFRQMGTYWHHCLETQSSKIQ